jgi:ubiquinone biosynthesis protein
MSLLSTGRQLGRTLKNASRLRHIVAVFAKHGFANVAERIQLGQFILERLNPKADIEKYSMPERVRMTFEELGPTFVKLGQLLATRPDLVSEDFINEFEKLHDQVNPLPFEVIENVLRHEFSDNLYVHFKSIDPAPLGSASIAQAHRAILADGTVVVVKVQRPGIIQTINDDLNVLYLIADMIEKYADEMRHFNFRGIVDEYFKTLELETNFVVEANNIRRFQQNFANDPHIKIPRVFLELTRERVLTMQFMTGIPLSADGALAQEGIVPAEVVRRGFKAYLKMVFKDGLFHGDLHAGNFFVMPHNNIGLIDFGVVGRLNSRTQSAIANMIMALTKEDYERLAFEYIDLAPFSERVNVDLFARQLRDLVAPYFGLTLKNFNIGQLLLKSSGIAADQGLSVPTELMLFFKSLVAIEGMGRRIEKDFDFMSSVLELASELVKTQFDPTRLMQDLSQVARESKSLISALPRQIHFYLRRINSPDYLFRTSVKELEPLRRSIVTSFNLLFLGIIIGCLLLSGSILFTAPNQHQVSGMPTASFVAFLLAAFLGAVAFWNYIRK